MPLQVTGQQMSCSIERCRPFAGADPQRHGRRLAIDIESDECDGLGREAKRFVMPCRSGAANEQKQQQQ